MPDESIPARVARAFDIADESAEMLKAQLGPQDPLTRQLDALTIDVLAEQHAVRQALIEIALGVQRLIENAD